LPVSETEHPILRNSITDLAAVTTPRLPVEAATAGFRWGVLVLFVIAIGAGGAAGWYLRIFGLPF